MNFINLLTIKHKTYILVLLSVATALILSLVSNNGLKKIRLEIDHLILASKIERFTNQLFVEEQKYRLNANGSIYNLEAANLAHNNTIITIDEIYQALNEVDNMESDAVIREYQKKTFESINRYNNLYLKGVKLLTQLNEEASILVAEGEAITNQIQTYVEAKRVEVKQEMTQETIEKINNGSNIWQYTYVTRLHEQSYRLSPSNTVLTSFKKDFQFMMSEWERLKEMSDKKSELTALKQFKIASKKYKTAMFLWVNLHRQLVDEVLPEMKLLGETVIEDTIQTANNSLNHVSSKHENLMIILFIVSILTIILGIFFGSMIARSISSAVSSFKSGLLNFFQYLNQQQVEVQPIIVEGRNEISVMAKVINDHIFKVQGVLKRKEEYQQVLLEWSKVDYQDETITMQKATELSARALQVDRVSIWLFNDEKNILRCAELYTNHSDSHDSCMLLSEQDYPEYFKALYDSKMMVIEDARTDKRTREFNEHYLIPLNIYSMLDLPIVNVGQLIGVICHESIGKKKSWTLDELDFANSMVHAISLSLEIKKRLVVQQELNALFDQIPSGVAVYKAVDDGNDFVFKDFNRAAEQIEKVNKDDLLGKRVKNIYPNNKELGLFKVLQNVWQSGKTEKFIDAVYKENSTISSWRDTWVYKLPSGDIVAVYEDITKRKQVEEQNALISTVYENTSEAIIITDADSVIINCNQAYTDITGYSLEEIKGLKPNSFSSGHHDKAFYQAMWQSIQQDGCWTGEIWDRRKNGEVYPKRLSINEVLNSEDKVSHYIGVFSDITHIKETEQKLENLAFRDALTGLPNRQLFHDRLAHELSHADRHNNKIALFFIDLDQFKQVNDTHGHQLGDELLQEVAKRLKSCVRENDTVARLGGDEFTIILTDLVSSNTAADIAQNVINTISKAIVLHDYELFVGASIGISLYPDDSHKEDILIRNADAAMYHAKEKGRGNFQFFSEQINQRNQKRSQLEKNLRRAIKNEEFELYYQPQIDILTNKVIGSEALIRWNDPQRGLISPLDFIPIAEENGMILEIGSWVFRQACKHLRHCMDLGHKPLGMAINLSAIQFRDEGLIDMIKAAIKKEDLSAELLELEITESAIMEDADNAIAVLEQLSAFGIRISIDDFGTGYSSLAYLKKFPIDKLKIDREFIKDLPNNNDDVVLTTTMINLSNSMGIDVLAEGVETKEQIEFLRQNGCHYVQGYYYSKPLPEDEFITYLHSEL